jgi:DnaJ domain
MNYTRVCQGTIQNLERYNFALRSKLCYYNVCNVNICCYFFTNAQQMQKDDPYAVLGLQYGATQVEIKAAFRELASKLHPDVNTVDTKESAQKKFQRLSIAYERLTKTSKGHPKLDDDEWQWSIWLRSTNIAESRTDVAGVLKGRPIPPVVIMNGNHQQQHIIGHPAGLGTNRRGEHLGTLNRSDQPSSSVGSGKNKWVEQKPYQPWNGRRETK